MGLASSQGRLLMLTGRQSDLEFSSMNKCQERLIITDQSGQLSETDNKLRKELSDYEDQYSNLAKQIGANVSGGIFGAVVGFAKKVGSFFVHLFGGKTKEDRIKEKMEQIKRKAEGVKKQEEALQNKMNILHEKDKKLEIQIKQIDTQHKAVQTELESIQKTVDKNIETSFKILG